ncbi:cellulase family glycosylhydrolase [Natronobiforma cellulositropha]|uniref:cellulase family glycosylhydrolase n=1 Tax=Natronobiforma cellulositropha TaxID=1679076 RepID=UPI0021D58D92|nr:cellulase family glycosylhydrolase [Natronobiforma cellulositropha]
MRHETEADERTDERAHPPGSDSAQGTVGGATRRDFLKVAGAAGGALALGSAATGTATATTEKQIPTPWLHVEGNLIKDPLGEEVKLRGLNMADPKRINVTAPARGMTAPQVVEFLTDQSRGWYPRVIRIPVQPIDIGEYEPGHTGGPPDAVAFTRAELEDYIETHLDPVVEKCKERGVYAIVDYHRHWGDGDFEWDQADLADEVDMFWDTMAPHYAEESHVIFEVYNEPTEPGMWTTLENDADIWLEWKDTAQPWVDTIREHAPHNLILVGSPSWTQNPEGYYVEPFDGENLAYTYHIYPGHTVSRNEAWDTDHTEGMQGVHEDAPVVVTEFGWQNDIRSDYLRGSTSEFGEPFMDFLEENDGLHWTAWCADPTWRPVMFNRPFAPVDHTDEEDSIGHPYEDDIPEYCDELPCEWSLLGRDEGDYDDFMGGFIQDVLEENRDDRIPTVEFDDQPPEVPDPEVFEVTQTTVELAWDTVDSPGDSPFSHYNVFLDGVKHTEVPGSETSVTLVDLLADKTFEIGVSAEDGTGNESAPGTVTVTTEPFDDDEPPYVPDDLAVAEKTHRTITLEWGSVEDRGPAGLHHYRLYVDGEETVQIREGTTSTTLTDMLPDTTYEIAVSAVDFAQNESATSETIAVRTEADRPHANDLVINDYEGDPEWPEANKLGNWIGGDGFEANEVTGDATLRFEYDDGGWYGTAVAQDISRYSHLMVRVSGDDGGEEAEVDVAFAGFEGLLSEVAEGHIEAGRMSLVSLDLSGAGESDLEDPGQLRFGFDHGGTGAIEIDALWLRDATVDYEPEPTAPAQPTGLTVVSATDSSVDLAWGSVADAAGYEVYLDGSLETETSGTTVTITGLETDSSYEFGVVAVSADGLESTVATVVGETGDGGGEPADLDVTGDGNPAQDLTGDELYEDVTGDGNLGFNDVVTFFEEHTGDVVQDNVERFDFSGNGQVGFNDVVALFERI